VVTRQKPTSHATALCHLMLTEPHAIYQDTNRLDQGIVNLEKDTAIHGMVSLVVTIIPVIKANTGIRCVDQSSILPNNVMPSSSLLIINFPFISSKWEAALNSTPIIKNFQMSILVFALVLKWESQLPP
jgi:hypothetical protein